MLDQVKELRKVLEEIQSTSGKNAKRDIIERNLNNILFKTVMKFLLNSFITTGISKKKLGKSLDSDQEFCTMSNLYDLLNYIRNNPNGRSVDIATAINFAEGFEEEEKNMILGIVKKDIKLGVSANTWNKVCGEKDKIPVFEVMLAKKYQDHKKKVKGTFIITKKLDGNRCVLIKESGVVKSFTRTGQPYNGLSHIEEELASSNYDNIVLDGELIADIEGTTMEVFSETSGLARRKSIKDKTSLHFHAFDMLSLEDFKNGKSSDNCRFRKLELIKFANPLNLTPSLDFKYIQAVEVLYVGEDIEEIDKQYKISQELGWEGIMVNLDSPYVCKRTDTLLKVKGMQSCDIKIVGFEEGSGRNIGKLGALVCDYKGNNVGVGSGFSDKLRTEIWDNRDGWLNKIVEIQYFEESTDSKTGNVSLRFPVFLRDRSGEKTEPSYN